MAEREAFDLERALAGEPLVTRDGKEPLNFRLEGNFFYADTPVQGMSVRYDLAGHFNHEGRPPSRFDLFMAPREEAAPKLAEPVDTDLLSDEEFKASEFYAQTSTALVAQNTPLQLAELYLWAERTRRKAEYRIAVLEESTVAMGQSSGHIAELRERAEGQLAEAQQENKRLKARVVETQTEIVEARLQSASDRNQLTAAQARIAVLEASPWAYKPAAKEGE